MRDRAGQQALRKEFGRWRGEQEGVWACEDVMARLDGVALPVFDRMLRVPSNHQDEDADTLTNLSPASRIRAYKHVYAPTAIQSTR